MPLLLTPSTTGAQLAMIQLWSTKCSSIAVLIIVPLRPHFHLGGTLKSFRLDLRESMAEPWPYGTEYATLTDPSTMELHGVIYLNPEIMLGLRFHSVDFPSRRYHVEKTIRKKSLLVVQLGECCFSS